MSKNVKKWQKTVIIILCIALVWGVISILPRPKSVKENSYVMGGGNKPLLIAHGGGNREFPDNTLEACYNAYSVDKNVMLELDGSITKDGVFILSHDTTLNYRTNEVGAISDWTYTDLVEKQVDFSYLNKNSKSENREIVKYTNYKGEEVTPKDVTYPVGISPRHEEKFLVTTFEDVLKTFPNNTINIEIKQSGETGIKALKEVMRLTKVYNAFDRVIFASFHEEIIKEIKKEVKNADFPIHYSPAYLGVAGILVTSWVGLDLFYNEPITVLQVPMSETIKGITLRCDTKGFVKAAHKHNISIQYWTIDDENDMRYLISIGADGIMTNRPHLLKEVYDDVFKK